MDKYIQYAIDTKQQEIYLTLIHIRTRSGVYGDFQEVPAVIEQKELTATTQHRTLVKVSGEFYALVEIQRLPLQREKATFSYTKSTGSSCRLGRSGAFLLQSVDSVF